MTDETIQNRDALLESWEQIARDAEASDRFVFKVPTGNGLAYQLAWREMVKRYYPVADMPPGFDYYRLDIPPR